MSGSFSDGMLADLADDGVLRVERSNHLFEHVTASVANGVRAGRRCQRCGQWAMGEFPGDSASEVCPKAVHRYVTEWRPGLTPASSGVSS